MKRIEVIIPPGDAGTIARALAVEGVRGMTVVEAQGWGIRRGLGQEKPSDVGEIRVARKMKVDMVVHAHEAYEIVTRLKQVLDTSDVGPGKIFVSDIEDVLHTRTGERGQNALGGQFISTR
jgi:nitrogen regulatory protein P-II 2